MKPAATIPIEELNTEPYATVVCYPRMSTSEMIVRIDELRQLGVEKVEFDGKAQAFSVPILGKGYVGIVVAAYVDDKKFALKMQRIDSDRENFAREGELLQLANSVGVGPKFYGVTKRFLLMELVEGVLLEEWLQTHTNTTVVKRLLEHILEQCWRLDTISLDHGELSKAPKHLLVNKQDEPFIVDFETASTCRNASNVTSVCQYLFQGYSEACKSIAQVLGDRDKVAFVGALRNYRKQRTRENFDALLCLCLSKTSQA